MQTDGQHTVRTTHNKSSTTTRNFGVARAPLTDLTPFMTNQNIIPPVVVDGRSLSARCGASQPCPSYHDYRAPKMSINVQTLRTNLLEKFCNENNSETHHCTQTVSQNKLLTSKRACGRPKKRVGHLDCTTNSVLLQDFGSSSNTIV